MYCRPSTFEEQYTTIGQPSMSASNNRLEEQEQEFDQVALAVQRQQSHSTYYSSVEQEENVKCIISTVIFIGIIFIVLLLAFTINPQMA